MIGSPSVSTPTSGAIVAVAMTFTVEVLIPPKTSGRASGSSTERTISKPDIPMPRAASTASRLTCSTPTYAFVRIGGIASSASAPVTFQNSGVLGKNATKKAISAMLGTARPTLEIEIVANAPRRVCPSASPSGSETAIAIAIATAVTLRCVAISGSSSEPPTRAPPACDSRELKM